jgi:alpha-galactosidase/6-phospho-beta-glucosidase family protein
MDAEFVITAIAVGPGNIMCAFRHIPVLVEMVKELEEVSPKAWVFNNTILTPCLLIAWL